MDETSTTSVLEADITGIRFCLASHKEIRTASISECAITHASQLSNPFLGLPLEYGKCEACGAAEPGLCEGHFGFIELPIPIYHSCHVDELKRLLSLLCLKCLKLKKRKFPLNSSSGAGDKLLPYCCEEASLISIKEMKTGDGASYLQLKVPSKGRIREGFWNFLEKYGYRFSDGFTRTLLPIEALGMLKNIHAETKRKLAGKGYFPQDGYLIKYLPVPPNCLSVPDVSDGVSVMSSDHSSNLLRKILKQVEAIKTSRSGAPNFESHEVEANDLQLAVEQYFQVRGTAKTSHERDTRYGISKESTDSSTKAWLEKMRTLFIKKGSGFSSRSVITGDSYRGVSEIGVPADIAQRVTVEERVNAHNLTCLQGLVDRKLCLTYRDGDATYSLKEGSKGHTTLRIGQIVHRRIMDGDTVFINRPPTTHKHSLQALSVYVHDDHTVKINPLICGPLSADFDGDCVHLFYPQSLSAKAEVLELFSVEKQLPSSHTGSLNLQLVTDSLLSLKMLVKSVSLEKVQVQQLAMFVASPLAQPATVKAPSLGLLWTAPQILASSLPASFDSIGETHLIKNSEILKMDLDTDTLSSFFKELVASIFAEKGPKTVLEFFDQIQPMLMEYIFAKGFSVSLEDFTVLRSLTQHIHRDIDEMAKLLMDLRAVNNELLEVQLENRLMALRNFVSTSMIKSSALGDLIDSKSESASSKVVQQVGFLGSQLADKGKFYTKTLVEDIGRCYEDKYPCGADYPTARFGLLRNCFINGIDPYEELVHSISSREVMVRSSRGLAEPGTLFKNLMAILRDVVICYDGTVRNVCSNSIIEFDYVVESKHKHLFQAGEPVGVLAATAMSNPAYKAVLDSSPSSNSSWELMKEILLCRVNFKNESNDRRAILYLNECNCGRNNCQERAAYMVLNHLKKFSLKDAAVEFMIEYVNNSATTDYPRAESGLNGHIHLNKELLYKFNVSMQEVLQKCQETINSFRKKKKVDQIFKCTSLSISECCPCDGKWSGMPCLTFCLHDSSDCHLERSSQILADIICPALLETIIKGDSRVFSANITWISPDTTTWIRSPSKNWKGELAVDVVLEKASVKQSGDAWRVLLDCCLPVLHLIDSRRSVPYAIKQVQELLGISCAFEQAIQRLSRSVTMVTKGVLKEHLLLLANSMACSGNLIGFTVGGYKALIRSMNIQVPFTEATLYTPKKCFERAAEKCHSDSLSGVVASCSWGKSVAVGTGASFEILLNTDEMGINQGQGGGIDVYSFLHMVSSANGDHLLDTDCLGADVDYMSDDKDFAMSPEHDSGSTKPTFDDADLLEKLEQPSSWGQKVDEANKSSSWGNEVSISESGSRGWGQKGNETSNPSSWGNKEAPTESDARGWGSKADERNTSSVWGKKANATDPDASGWDQKGVDTNTSSAWGKKEAITELDGRRWESKAVETNTSSAWGKKATVTDPDASGWGQKGDETNTSSAWGKKGATERDARGWGSKADENNNSSGWGKKEAVTDLDASGWGQKGDETNTSSAWGNNAAATERGSGGYASKADETNSSSGWGKKATVTDLDASGWGEKGDETNTSSAWGNKAAVTELDAKGWGSEAGEKNTSSAWGKKSDVTEPDASGWGSKASNTNISSSWGKKVAIAESALTDSGKPMEKPGRGAPWNQSSGTQWGVKEADSTVPGGWGKPAEKTGQGSWNQSSGQNMGNTNEALDTTVSGSWGEKGTETQSSDRPWGKTNDPEDKNSWAKNTTDIQSQEQPWGATNEAATRSESDGWDKKASETKSGWGHSVEAADEPWGKKIHKNPSESEPIQWGNRTGSKRKQEFGSNTRPPRPIERYTVEEQEILGVIEPIVNNVKRILHGSGYNEGDRISADDEAYLLNEVLKYHPNKAEKMGAGVDHITINKHSTYQNSRCFYVQRSDGQQEDFSTRKCMMSLITERFPDIAENFIKKYYPRQADKEKDAVAKETDSAAGTPQAD